MASRHEKMYADSPSVERDGESGKVSIKKPSQKKAETDLGDGGPIEVHQAHARREMTHRHVAERLALHHRHEMEHDHGKGEHGRHAEELKEMHRRHESEMKSHGSKHGSKEEPKGEKTGEKKIEKIEEGKKE